MAIQVVISSVKRVWTLELNGLVLKISKKTSMYFDKDTIRLMFSRLNFKEAWMS